MKKSISTLVVVSLLAIAAAGCGGGGGGSLVAGLAPTAGLTIKLKLPATEGAAKAGSANPLQTAVNDITSITITITGTNYTRVSKSFSVQNGQGDFTIDSLTPAENLLLEIFVYSQTDVPEYYVSTTITLKAGYVTEVPANQNDSLTLIPYRPDAVVLSLGAYTSGPSVTLNWTQSTDEYFQSYKVYYDSQAAYNAATGVTEASTLLGTAGSISLVTATINTLAYGDIYYFKVFVISESGWSTASNEVSLNTVDPDPVVVFNDNNLETAVRNALVTASVISAPDDITESAAADAAFTTLDASSSAIDDLTGLEKCTALTSLNLSGNTATNISPLAGLTTLTVLNLDGNQIVDFSHLTGLQNLTSLVLTNTGLDDLTALMNLVTLQNLTLTDNQIIDLTALQGLTNLVTLNLVNNLVSDITALVNNNGIDSGDTVYLGGTDLDAGDQADIDTLTGRGVTVNSDLVVTFHDAGLEGTIRTALTRPTGNVYFSDLAGLTTLNASGAGITVLTDLQYCTSLTTLDLSGNTVTDISTLTGLTTLTSLDLSANATLAALTNIQNLTALQTLDLADTQVADISELQYLTSLTYLDLTNSQVADVSPLANNAGIGAASQVLLNGTNVDDSDNDSDLTADLQEIIDNGADVTHEVDALQIVTISDTNLLAVVRSSIPKPAGNIYRGEMATLVTLNAVAVNIADLTGLEYAVNLTLLNLSGNSLVAASDLTPLTYLTSLAVLDLSNNQISVLTEIGSLAMVADLNLANNQITDISSLSMLTSSVIDLSGNTNLSVITALGSIGLNEVYLQNTSVDDISALANNAALTGGGDIVNVENTSLDAGDQGDIDTLTGRGVTVVHNLAGGGANNHSLGFDGASGHVNCGDVNIIEGKSELTISAWVKWNNPARLSTILSKRFGHSDKIQFGLGETGNTDDLRIQIGSTSLGYGYTTGGFISTGIWYHLVMVFDGNGSGDSQKLKIYINGDSKTLTYNGTIPSTTCSNDAPVTIGSEDTNAGVTNIDGYIDEVAIWDRALNNSEITAIYNSGTPTDLSSNSGLVCYWRFEEGSGTTAIDATGLGNDGVINSAVHSPVVP